MSTLVEAAVQAGMSELQMNAIMGSLLGDGCLRPSGRTTKGLRWNHGLPQEEYVYHKYNLLSEFATRPPFRAPNPGYGDTWTVLTLRSMHVLHCMYVLTHPNGCTKKTVTPEFLAEINHPIALAWWFMDDGSRMKNMNSGIIHTNGFSEEEVELLSDWLEDYWEIQSRPIMVKHSSTGNYGWQLLLSKPGFLKLRELILPYVPSCMKYKIELITRTCPICGTEFTRDGITICCSPECAVVHRQIQYEAYMELHHDELLQKHAEYREANRELIRQKSRERYANLTPEQKAELLEYTNQWRKNNPEKVAQIKKNYRERHKDDPEYQQALKEERARYYEKIRQDQERWSHRLAEARRRNHTAAYRERNREYLRKHRMEKRAENPEVLRKYQERMAHMEMLTNMTPEERAAYDREYQRQAYQKKLARMTPEGLAEFRAKQNEQSSIRWANKTPEQHVKIKAAQKKMRDSWTPEIRAKKAAQKKASYERKMAEIKADPEKYAAYLQKAREDYQKRQAAKKAKQTQQRPVYAVDPDLGFDF